MAARILTLNKTIATCENSQNAVQNVMATTAAPTEYLFFFSVFSEFL